MKFVTATPLGVNLVSASLPRCPSKITLLTLRDAITCNVSYARTAERAGRRQRACLVLGEIRCNPGQRFFESGA